MPIAVVELRIIAAIVIAGPTRFLPKQRVPRDRLGGEDSVLQLPRPLQLMQIWSADAPEILLQHREELQPAIEELFARHVEHAVAADVLVHDLFEPLQALQRIDVARRYRPRDDLVPAHTV